VAVIRQRGFHRKSGDSLRSFALASGEHWQLARRRGP